MITNSLFSRMKGLSNKTRNKMRAAYQKDAKGRHKSGEGRLWPQLQCLGRHRVWVAANRVGRLTQTLLE
jgi:hypothetical protein